MKLQLKYSFLTVCLAAAIFACKDDKDVTPAVEERKDSIVDTYTTLKANGVVEVSNLPASREANYNDYVLYNFAKMAVVADDSINTAAWDLAFSESTGIDIVPNWGGTEPYYYDVLDFFAGNKSDVKVAVLDTAFDAVTVAPAAATFEHTIQITTAVPVFNTETGEVDHLDYPENIYVFLLNDGRYVKFQYISWYKDAPATPTSANDKNDRGYWTFKYFISEKGSTDLSTK